jgi:hypothetical protein
MAAPSAISPLLKQRLRSSRSTRLRSSGRAGGKLQSLPTATPRTTAAPIPRRAPIPAPLPLRPGCRLTSSRVIALRGTASVPFPLSARSVRLVSSMPMRVPTRRLPETPGAVTRMRAPEAEGDGSCACAPLTAANPVITPRVSIRAVRKLSRLGAGLVLLLSLLFSGPQGTLILAAMAECPPVKCMSRDCCCGPQGNAAPGCRLAPARCDPAAPFVLTAAKGVLPPPHASLFAFDASEPAFAAPPVRTADGHARRLDRPPRPSL